MAEKKQESALTRERQELLARREEQAERNAAAEAEMKAAAEESNARTAARLSELASEESDPKSAEETSGDGGKAVAGERRVRQMRNPETLGVTGRKARTESAEAKQAAGPTENKAAAKKAARR